MTDEYQIGSELTERVLTNTTALSQLSNPDISIQSLFPEISNPLISNPPTPLLPAAAQSVTPQINHGIDYVRNHVSQLMQLNNGTISRRAYGTDPITGLTGQRGIFCIGGEFGNNARHVTTFASENGLIPCYTTDFIPNQSPVPHTQSFTDFLLSFGDKIAPKTCPASYNPYALTIYEGPVATSSSWIHSIPGLSEIIGYGSGCWRSFSTTITEQCSKLPSTSQITAYLPSVPSLSDVTNTLPSMPTFPDIKENLPNLPSTSDLTTHLPTIPTTTDITSALGEFLTNNQDTLISTSVIAGAAIAAVGTVVGGLYCLRKIDENQRVAEQRRAEQRQEAKKNREYAKKNPDTPEGQAYLKKQKLLEVVHEFGKRYPLSEITLAYTRTYPKTKTRLERNESEAFTKLKKRKLLEGIHEFASLNPESKISKAYYKAYPKTFNRLRNRM